MHLTCNIYLFLATQESKYTFIIILTSTRHWVAYVICNLNRNKFGKQPFRIICMDSLQQTINTNHLMLLKAFVKNIHSIKGVKDVPAVDIAIKYLKFPKQSNSYDCGIYVIDYMRFFHENCSKQV